MVLSNEANRFLGVGWGCLSFHSMATMTPYGEGFHDTNMESDRVATHLYHEYPQGCLPDPPKTWQVSSDWCDHAAAGYVTHRALQFLTSTH